MEKAKVGNKIFRLAIIGDIVELSDKHKTFLMPAESFIEKCKYDTERKCFILSDVELSNFVSYDNDFENLFIKYLS